VTPGFGGPKPPLLALPTSTENCTLLPLQPDHNSTRPGGETEYFYLYRISYAWYSFLGTEVLPYFCLLQLLVVIIHILYVFTTVK
jgi:hypothetical protein